MQKLSSIYKKRASWNMPRAWYCSSCMISPVLKIGPATQHSTLTTKVIGFMVRCSRAGHPPT